MKADAIEPSNTSLEKGLTLLHHILSNHNRMTLTEIGRDLALTRSTLYRLVGALERHGLVVRTGRGVFEAALPLAETLSRFSVPERLARVSRPLLRRLAYSSNAAAHLGILENDMVTYLVKAASNVKTASSLFTREGGQLEAYCSGIGKVLLAHLPLGEQLAYLEAGPFVPLTAQTITDRPMLEACLEAVKADHYARDDGEISDDLYCLAVPVRDKRGGVIAAMSLSFSRQGRSPTADRDPLEQLKACSEELSTKLGI